MTHRILLALGLIAATATARAQNTGIGTISPTDQLHTTGTVRFQNYYGYGTRIVQMDSSGRLIVQGAGPVSANTTVTTIPDNGCSTTNGITSNITITGQAAAVPSARIAVRVNILHAADAELTLILYSPGGARLVLAKGNGGTGSNFIGTIFTDAAAQNISAGTAPFTGSYKPSGTLLSSCALFGTVSTFAAIGGGTVVPNGTWTLKVFDGTAGNTGYLNDWSITFYGADGYTADAQNNFLPMYSSGGLVPSTFYQDPAGGIAAGGNNVASGGGGAIAIGQYNTASGASGSVALGKNASAAGGQGATAIGYSAYAGYDGSIAIGHSASAGAADAVAIGSGANATKANSVAIGVSTADGIYALATGYGTEAAGTASTALGAFTKAAGDYSLSGGTGTMSSGYGSVALGVGTIARAYGSLAVGLYNDSITSSSPTSSVYNDPVFYVGNGGAGIFTVSRSNALVVYKNGNAALQNDLTVAGGKGMIRNTGSAQLKYVVTSVNINPGAMAANGSTSIPVTFSQSFSSAPVVYVGNMTAGGGGWAETMLTPIFSNTTGCTLWIHNTLQTSSSPNYTINIIAVGPQ